MCQKEYHNFKALFLIIACAFNTSIIAQVRVYEDKEVIPTNEIRTRPAQYSIRAGVFGLLRDMYFRTPSQTRLGDSLVDVSHDMVYLENEYLIVKVLPEFGGRLFLVIDKTNGH